jgi:hypothetical protein
MEPVYLIVGLICGGACALIAHGKGRSPIAWFFIGLILGVIGVVMSLVSSNRKQIDYTRIQQDQENRRLREQLRQERIKHETLRDYTMRRLDAHDQVLGVDTRSLQALPTDNPQNLLPTAEVAIPASPAAIQQPAPPHSNAWYFEQNGETRGPVPPEVIHTMLAENQLTGTTLLWADHLPDWRPAALIPEFQHRAT